VTRKPNPDAGERPAAPAPASPCAAAAERLARSAPPLQDAAVCPPARLALRITSDPANLAPVRHQIEGFCAACGFDEKARGQIVLCVNEALANITRHAYLEANDGPVHLDVEFAEGRLKIAIRDWGTGRLPPEKPRPRDPLQPGGVGLVCLRELMDEITFSPQPDGMLLTMERKP